MIEARPQNMPILAIRQTRANGSALRCAQIKGEAKRIPFLSPGTTSFANFGAGQGQSRPDGGEGRQIAARYPGYALGQRTALDRAELGVQSLQRCGMVADRPHTGLLLSGGPFFFLPARRPYRACAVSRCRTPSLSWVDLVIGLGADRFRGMLRSGPVENHSSVSTHVSPAKPMLPGMPVSFSRLRFVAAGRQHTHPAIFATPRGCRGLTILPAPTAGADFLVRCTEFLGANLDATRSSRAGSM